ncbi:hypothetical protein B0T18DRAFT_337121 [Schizothecium vesticola]|uniref:Uncharacterized protein n=1 Tax=Schizothecium vesticola TaxID=314040 RepID=A0AA40F9B3_9PEZI|nr:hypothetical protein B0T18DRAFT_337121 [Schizothecium vesticola]
MLDENLPTFRFRPSPDNPLSQVLYFTHKGSDPAAEYIFRRADPASPASRNTYAVALCGTVNTGVIYGEVLVEPEWSQPTLSAAELRAQSQSAAPPPAATAEVPESFTIQLYNPDQTITVKMVSGSWGKKDTWEFDVPVQSFRQPSASELDRQTGSPADLVPRVLFRWKKDGRLSKDLTCFMSGTSLGGRKNKEPDITVAMFKAARDSIVTVYEPNLHRVEVEDRKGLEVILLLSAEVIKELYVAPRSDLFNLSSDGPGPAKRKNSRPNVTFAVPPQQNPTSRPSPPITTSASAVPPATADIDAETRRLQAMVEREEREREKRERAEQKRIKRMLEDEDRERRRREAEVAKETERLRKKYGVDGQTIPPLPPRPASHAPPPPQYAQPPPPQQGYYPPPPVGVGGLSPWGAGPAPTLPPRPVSAGPSSANGAGPFHCAKLNMLWNGPGAGGWSSLITPPPHMAGQQGQSSQQQQGRPRHGSSGSSVGADGGRRVRRKRSSVW